MKSIILLAIIDAFCFWSIRGRSATLSEHSAVALVAQSDADAKECQDLARAARKLLRKELGLTETRLTVKADVLCAQDGLEGKVSLDDALRAGINSLLTDSSDVESPLALVRDVQGVTDPEEAKANLKELLAHSTTRVRLMARGEAPEGGESIDESWVLEIEIPDLGDTTFWAVVDRTGARPAYNYGFN